MVMHVDRRPSGLTLVEIMVAVGIVSLVISAIILALNPARQFAKARNSQRQHDVREIYQAITTYASNNSGQYPGGITSQPKTIGTNPDVLRYVNLEPVLVPQYMSNLPLDPTAGTTADTGYQVFLDQNNRLVALASYAELNILISSGSKDLSPNQVADLKLWLRADGTVASDGAADFVSVSSQSLSIPDNASLSMAGTSFTLATWVYMKSTQVQHHTFIGKFIGAGGNREYYLWYKWDSNRFIFSASSTGLNETTLQASTFGAPSPNTWYFLVAWYDTGSGTINIQVNDGAVNSSAFAGGVFDGAAEFTLGARDNGNYAFADARMDSTGVWKRILTGSERQALYNGGAGIAYSGLSTGLKSQLVSWWNLDETGGTRIDAQGANNLASVNAVAGGSGIVTMPAGNGQSVAVWQDDSGNGYHARQTTGSARPTYITLAVNNKPAIRFNGTSQWLVNGSGSVLPALGSGDFSLFLVVLPTDINTTRTALMLGTSATNQALTASTDGVVKDGSIVWGRFGATLLDTVSPPGLSTSAYGLLTTVEKSGLLRAWVNAVSADPPTVVQTLSITGTGLSVGAQRNGSQFWQGDIAEVVLYGRELTEGERLGVESYLKNKYKL